MPLPQEPARPDDLFGAIAFRKGYVTQEQLDSCLEQQRTHTTHARKVGLAKLLLDRGFLTMTQVKEILRLQNRTVLFCQPCGKKFTVPRNLLDQALRCPRCQTPLHLPRQPTLPSPPPRIPPKEIGAENPPLSIGQVIHHYQILELIGTGGMSMVYRARHLLLGDTVALKILHPRLVSNSNVVDRFLRESEVLTHLRHPHIVRLEEKGQAGDLYFMAMEYVPGKNLHELLSHASSPLSCPQVVAMAVQVLDALHCAHSNGVIHRDIKPGNIIFLPNTGEVKVADFGIAYLLSQAEESTALTGKEAYLGTESYMAPEQREAPDQVDERADLFSLGVLMYVSLTRRYPKGVFPPPSHWQPEASPGLDRVVLKAMEHDPARRFSSAEDFKNQLLAANAPHAKRPRLFRWFSGPPPQDPAP